MDRENIRSKVVSPRLHERFRPLLESVFGNEDEEEDYAVAANGTDRLSSLSGLNLIIDYQDARGNVSQRVISCRQYVQADEKNYLKAYCHHRSAMRSFRLDRVIDVYDPVTGECLSPVEIFFVQFAPDAVQESGLSWGLSIARKADLIALLNALVFLARCDREFHVAERRSLEQAISSFLLRLEIRGEPDCDAILNFADKLSPDGELFWVALHHLKTNDELKKIFRRTAQTLIEADGIVKEIEVYWALEFQSFLDE